MKQIVTANFGASWSTNEQVSHILLTRLGPSLTVLVPLLVLENVIAIGLALAVAYIRGSLTDHHGEMIVCTVGLSISILVYIIVFQYVFAYKPRLVPGAGGWGDSFWENLTRYAMLPILIRPGGEHRAQPAALPHVRAGRDQPGLRAHRARQGRRRRTASCGYVLRNASIPIITHVMAALPGLLIGAFLIERFFSIPASAAR